MKKVLLGFEVGTAEELSIDYITGFFDGEGHARLSAGKNGILQPDLTFHNTNRTVLERVHATLKMGHINLKGQRGHPEWKDAYEFKIQRWEDCLKLAKMMLPKAIVKHSALQKIIDFLETHQKRKGPRPYTRPFNISREELVEFYVIQQLGTQEIAGKFGTTRTTVWRRLKKEGIVRRSNHDAQVARLMHQ